MTRFARAGLSASTALSLAIALPALAQGADDAAPGSENSEFSDIIVTARRSEERLQDVPISITVFNQEQLTDRNIVKAMDLVTYTPSLSANNLIGSDNTTFAIRGFNQDIGTAASVGVYFADVVAPRAAGPGVNIGNGAGPGAFFDLQSVQVLKGPQGTLFGRNTTGGAVLLVPQKPTDAFEGYVEASVGSYNLRRVQGVINIPLGSSARLRLSGDYNDRDGYLRNTTGIGPRSFEDVHYYAVRASLAIDLTPTLENYMVASYTDSDRTGSIPKVIACNPNGIIGFLACDQLARARARGDGFFTVQATAPNLSSRIAQAQIINTTTWQASDNLTVKNIISYAEIRDRRQTQYPGVDWFAVNNQPVTGANYTTNGTPIILTEIRPPRGADSANQATFTEELQVQGNSADGRLVYQGGVYFESSPTIERQGSQNGTLLACNGATAINFQCTDVLGAGLTQLLGFPVNVGAIPVAYGTTDYQNVGVYGQATYSPTDQFKVTAGLRYTWDRQKTTDQRFTYTFPVSPPLEGPTTVSCTNTTTTLPDCLIERSGKWSAPTWLLGLDYNPTDNLLLYAKYSRGYRSGGLITVAPNDYISFGAEKVDTYEGGFKFEAAGPVRGYLNVSAFYNDFQNQQMQAGFTGRPGTGVVNTTGIVNAGKSRIYGVELEAMLRPVEGLTFRGSYSYLNTKIAEIRTLTSTDPNFEITSQIPQGVPLLQTPKNKFTVSGTYELPLDERFGRISLGATFSHTDRNLATYYYLDPAVAAAFGGNLGLLPAQNLLNLNINWNSVAESPFDVALFATNVTNQKYYTFIAGLGVTGAEVAQIGEPRMYGIRLRYNFGR